MAEDALRAGAGHCNPDAVRILAEEGPDAVRDVLLGRAPVAFDRKPEGELSLAAGLGTAGRRRAARHIRARLRPDAEAGQRPERVDFHDAGDIPAWSYAEDGAADPALISQDMSSLQYVMWNYVGLVRTTRSWRRPCASCAPWRVKSNASTAARR